MQILGIPVKDPQEIFTHLENDTGIARTFLIETMTQFARENLGDPLFGLVLVGTDIPLKLEVAAYLRSNQGIEQNRIDRLKNPYLRQPIIAISWGQDENGTDEITVIDGNHRYVKRAERGDKTIPCIIFRRQLWEIFWLPDHLSKRLVNEGFLNRVSGMIEKEKAHEKNKH